MGDIEKLDMSLDDIIKKAGDKTTKPAKATGISQRSKIQQKRRGGAAAGAGRGGARAGRGAGRTARAPILVTGKASVGLTGKGVRKVAGKPTGGVAGRGGGLRGRGLAAAARRPGGRGRGGLAGNANWTHDLYEGPARGQTGRQQGATLLISNLNYNVSNDDIKELFSSLGPLISYGINYDRSGRSEGTAQVVYRQKEHALAAMKRYNNVALDNQKMVISLREPSNPNVLTTLSSGISVTRAGGSAPLRGNQAAPSVGRGGGGRGRGGRSNRGRGGRGQGRQGGAVDMETDG